MYASENEKSYWQNELSTLGIECKREDEHNDKELVIAVKEFFFQYYKAAYDSNNTEIFDE
jgi:hypothetical protein